MSRIVYAVGTRPNFIKLAALYPHLPGPVYSTGQHWGAMRDPFLSEYGLPEPKPLAEMTGDSSDIAVVFGDCRCTLEGAVKAKSLGMRLAHVEAGLRCGDLDMEEERIRTAVDAMSDFLFCPNQDAVDNLESERKIEARLHKGKVFTVGNVVIDTLVPLRYGLLTLHRPFNVDNVARLDDIAAAVSHAGLPFLWPVHPRVSPGGGYFDRYGLTAGNQPFLSLVEPLARKAFIETLRGATVVVTDSGGVQEEAAFFGIPCITVRPSTERPITLRYGNRLTDVEGLTQAIRDAVPSVPLWDGRAGERIAEILKAEL